MGKLIALRYAKTKHINRFKKNGTNSWRMSIGGYRRAARDGSEATESQSRRERTHGHFGLRLLPSRPPALLGWGSPGQRRKRAKEGNYGPFCVED